jgi:hypothetical protein
MGLREAYRRPNKLEIYIIMFCGDKRGVELFLNFKSIFRDF